MFDQLFTHLECTHDGEIRKIGISLDGRHSYQVDGERRFVPMSELIDCESIWHDITIPIWWYRRTESPSFNTIENMKTTLSIIALVCLFSFLLFVTLVSMRRKKSPALVFDFDGVLAIPWSKPEKPYVQVTELIRRLHREGYRLSVASYNPRARVAVRSWGLEHCFESFRSGADHDWETEGGEYKEEFRTDRMSKHGQIKSMHGKRQVVFFDDSKENIDVINAKNDPRIHAVLVDTEKGVTESVVFEELNKIKTS